MPSTQERILLSARHCFEHQGLRQTRMEDIAGHAGLSRQTLYKHFISKQDIIDHLALREMIGINEQLRKELRPFDDFADRLTEIIVTSVEIALPNPYIRAMLADIDHLTGYPMRNPKLYEWQVEKWRRFLHEARANGELAQDVDISAAVRWITMCQLLLIITLPKLTARHVAVRSFVQRFMVAPLLYTFMPHISDEISAEQAPEPEGEGLRTLVVAQSLEIFHLRQKLAEAKTLSNA